jgi:hypothetical protein
MIIKIIRAKSRRLQPSTAAGVFPVPLVPPARAASAVAPHVNAGVASRHRVTVRARSRFLLLFDVLPQLGEDTIELRASPRTEQPIDVAAECPDGRAIANGPFEQRFPLRIASASWTGDAAESYDPMEHVEWFAVRHLDTSHYVELAAGLRAAASQVRDYAPLAFPQRRDVPALPTLHS